MIESGCVEILPLRWGLDGAFYTRILQSIKSPCCPGTSDALGKLTRILTLLGAVVVGSPTTICPPVRQEEKNHDMPRNEASFADLVIAMPASMWIWDLR